MGVGQSIPDRLRASSGETWPRPPPDGRDLNGRLLALAPALGNPNAHYRTRGQLGRLYTNFTDGTTATLSAQPQPQAAQLCERDPGIFVVMLASDLKQPRVSTLI